MNESPCTLAWFRFNVRMTARVAEAERADPVAWIVRYVAAALQNGTEPVACEAARVLCRIGPPARVAVPALRGALRGRTTELARAAAAALAAIAGAPVSGVGGRGDHSGAGGSSWRGAGGRVA